MNSKVYNYIFNKFVSETNLITFPGIPQLFYKANIQQAIESLQLWHDLPEEKTTITHITPTYFLIL
jgi:hypothetical protein